MTKFCIMGGQIEVLSCPFCDKGVIKCLYFPGALRVKRSGARSLPGKTAVSKTSDDWIIQSSCPVCGKSEEDVERKLKELNII
jgi:hypothetical protein